MDLIEKNLEVKLSWEILETLMSRQYAHVNYLFMDNTESMKWNNDFRNTGMVPMCFTKMNEKFINGTYRGIREFVCDFRLMLLNCYRTHGISSRAGRCAEKLELLLEQKLQLLSPEIRNKASIQSTLGFGTAEDELLDCGITRRRSSGRLFLSGDSRQLTPIRAIMEELEHVTHPGSGTGGITASLISNSIDSSTSASSSGQQTSAISSTLSTEENIAILVARLSLWQRRRHEEELLDTWNSWWVENNGPKMQEILFNAPELLEAYQFLWLADPFLGISDCITIYNNNNNNHNNLAVNALSTTASHTRSLSLFDLEIGLCTAPCASLVLNVCMSNLLATPKERNQIVNVLSNTTTTTNNNNSSNSNLSVGADSSTTTDYFSAAARRSRQLMSTTSTLPPLDYDIWERRLSARVDSWYRSFWDKGKGVVEWATYRLGLPKAFFDVCGYKSNPLEEKRFHELSIYQQVMLLCALCESTVRSFENLRVSLDRSADWEASNPVQLGIDFFSKHVYVHFPQLLGINPTTCLRVYRIPYVKHQPIECSFFKTAKNTNACNLKDMYKAKILNDFTKFAEILEETVSVKSENDDNSNNNNNSKKSNKRRRPSTKLKPEDTIDPVNHQQKLIEELNKHNNYLLENGLSVPGAVQRFPSWMHPALARDTYRRWHCVAEQCSAAASAAATANQIDELNKMNTTTTTNNNHHNNNKRTADRRSSVGVSRGATYPDNTPNSKSRNSINNNVTTNKDDLPFKDYQIIDEQIISEMMKRDHCLNPSPYASFNGPTRKFLSLQLSRTAIGGFRFCEKTHARRHNKKGVVNKNEEDDGGGGDDNNEEEDNDGDDDDDTESRSIDQNTNDPRSPSVSQYESDENESISGNSVQTRRRSTRLSNVAKQNGPVATNRTPSTRSSSLLDNKKEGATCKGKTEQSTTDKLNSTPSSSSSSSSSSNKQKISDDNNNNNNNNNNENNEGKVKKEKEEEGDEEEHEEEEEEEILVTEPPRESFTLVAKDTQEVNQLLLILRQLLASNEEKLMKSQIDCNLDSDCDDPSDGNNNNNNNNVDGIGVDVNGTGDADKKGDGDNDDDDSINEPAAKKKRLSPDCDDDGVNTQRRTMRLRNAVESLKRLIKNLEDLFTSLVDKESERVDAQRLARLRLRKDVEHWKEVEARKSKKSSAHNYNQDSSYTPVQESRSSLLASLHQIDTSKDRAERHLRRERRRQAQDSSDNDNDDSDGDDDNNNNEIGSDEDRKRKESVNNVAVVKQSNSNNHSPFSSKSTHLTPHNTSISPENNSTRSSISRRSINNNNNNSNNTSYQAFANRISASGTPKIPISRFSPEDTSSTVVVRRSALLEPRKAASILPKSPISYSSASSSSSSKLNSSTTTPPSYYNGNSSYSSSSGVLGRRPTDSSNSPYRTNTISRNHPSILRPCLTKSPPFNQNYHRHHHHQVNGLSTTLTHSPLSMTSLKKPTSPSPLSSSSSASPSSSIPRSNNNNSNTPGDKPPVRKIYRVCNTLFTEDAKPVKIGPNGCLIPIPLESIPMSQRQLARQMISRYHQHVNSTPSAMSSSSSSIASTITTTTTAATPGVSKTPTLSTTPSSVEAAAAAGNTTTAPTAKTPVAGPVKS